MSSRDTKSAPKAEKLGSTKRAQPDAERRASGTKRSGGEDKSEGKSEAQRSGGEDKSEAQRSGGEDKSEAQRSGGEDKSEAQRSGGEDKSEAQRSGEAQNLFDRLLEQLLAWRKLAAPLALAAALVVGLQLGLGAALLVLAGATLLAVIGLLWASVQSLTGESDLNLEEALSLAAPSVEEEQKRAVLRALKDLDFELKIGKISQEDYEELSLRYRAEAKRLLRQLAYVEADARAAARRRLEARLEARGLLSQVQGATQRAIDAEAKAAGDAEATTKQREEAADAAPSEPTVTRDHAEADLEIVRDTDDNATGAALADEGAAADQAAVRDTDEAAGEAKPQGEAPASSAGSDAQPAQAKPAKPKPAKPEPAPEPTSGPSRRCRECGHRSPLAAARCHACHSPLAGTGQRLCRSCPAIYDATEQSCPMCGVEASDDHVA